MFLNFDDLINDNLHSHSNTQLSFPILFLKSTETDLYIIESMIPATVKMPPTIAHTCIKNSKMFSFS